MPQHFFRTNPTMSQPYDYFETITILNPRQAAFYMSKKVHLLDVRLGNDRETGEPILLYYFNKEETRSAYDEWCNRRDGKN